MNMAIKKVFADLASSPARTLLVILALAIGIWGVSSIVVSYVILTNDLKANFINTQPPQAILTSENFSRLDLATLRSKPEIESAEFRDLSMQRIEVHPNDWIPLWLFGVENFSQPSLSKLATIKGAAIPPTGTMLMERDGHLISNLDVGSSAKIRADHSAKKIVISGITFDPAQAPATQDHFIYAYVDKLTYANLTGEATNQRLILRLRNVNSKQDVVVAIDKLRSEFLAQGIKLKKINIPKFNEHPHQWQLNTLLFLQGGIGLLAFLMGAVLVSQLMAAILAKQIRQIGIFKAIGASRYTILGMYLLMTLLLGLAAGVIAIPLAIKSGYAFSYFVAGKLNFDILTLHLPLHLYVLLITTSLLLPIFLSWPAIRKGINVSAYVALSDYGLTEKSSDATTAGRLTTHLPPGFLLALRNSLRQKKRLAITVLTMALGVAIFSTGFNVRASLALLLTDIKISMKHDVQVVLNEQITREQALATFKNLTNVERVETWNGGRGELQSRIVSTASGVGIVALPYDTDLFSPRFIAGRWLAKSEIPEVVMNQQALELYNNPAIGSALSLQIGDKIISVKLVGVVEELEKAKIYIDQAHYDAVANPEHTINSLMFVAKDKSDEKVNILKRDIEAIIATSSLKVLYVMSQAERVKVIYDHLNIILMIIVFLSFLVLVVSALGMASATGISIMERTREIGVLRAIGATPRMIYRLFVTEGFITSITSLIFGLIMAWPLSLLASVFFGRLMLGESATLRYTLSGEGLFITLFTTLLFAWLASRIPASRAIKISTRDALAYE